MEQAGGSEVVGSLNKSSPPLIFRYASTNTLYYSLSWIGIPLNAHRWCESTSFAELVLQTPGICSAATPGVLLALIGELPGGSLVHRALRSYSGWYMGNVWRRKSDVHGI